MSAAGSAVLFGELGPEHLPARRGFDFPYALGVLTRLHDGRVVCWLGASPDREVLYQPFKWMSVTKFAVAVAFWVAASPVEVPGARSRVEAGCGVSQAEAGSSLAGMAAVGGVGARAALDLEADVSALLPQIPPGVSLADLLSHSAGLPFDAPLGTPGSPDFQMGVDFGISTPEANNVPPGTKRIYSNYSIETAVQVAAGKLGLSWTDWVKSAVLEPLGMTGTILADSPSWGAKGPVTDLARLAGSLLFAQPTLLSAAEVQRWTAPRHPGLRGILPGWGFQKDNLWATGVELHGHKFPHWMPPDFPPGVFGHFGQSGSFIWVDRASGSAGVFLGGAPFGPKHREIWPQLNAEIRQLALLGQSSG